MHDHNLGTGLLERVDHYFTLLWRQFRLLSRIRAHAINCLGCISSLNIALISINEPCRFISVHTHAYTHTLIHTYTHTHTCIHTYTHTHTLIHTHTHTHSYIHTHTHTHLTHQGGNSSRWSASDAQHASERPGRCQHGGECNPAQRCTLL